LFLVVASSALFLDDFTAIACATLAYYNVYIVVLVPKYVVAFIVDGRVNETAARGRRMVHDGALS